MHSSKGAKSGILRSATGLLRTAGRAVRFILVPNTAGYFLWAGLSYLAASILLHISIPVIHDEFCTVVYSGSKCQECRDHNFLCGDSECYRSAMNITWRKEANAPSKQYFEALNGAVLDKDCTDIIKQAISPVDAIVQMDRASSSTPVNKECQTFHCRVLQNALYLNSDMQNKGDNCTNTWGTKSSDTALSCPCSSLLTEVNSQAETAIKNICGERVLTTGCSYFATTPSFCNSSSGGRRLDFVQEDEAPCQTPSSVLPDVRSVFAQQVGLSDAPARSLQSTSSTAPAWTVGQWSTCQCYDQCMPGVRTRVVACGATQCRGTQPATQEACTCYHCAECDAQDVMTVLMFIQYTQAGIALLLCPMIGYFGSLPEESLIKIGILKKLAGFFCKIFPALETLGDFAVLLILLWIMIVTFLPPLFNLEWMEDCFIQPVLRASSLILIACWLARLALGHCAKRYTRVAPQLYSPFRRLPAPLRQIRAMLGCLAPY